MRRFIVERLIPSIGSADRRELRAVAAQDQAAVKKLGGDIQWVESFISDDKTYCVYVAKNEDVVRRHSKMAGFPADKVTEVRVIIDPATADA